jgi:hypothetical protein
MELRYAHGGLGVLLDTKQQQQQHSLLSQASWGRLEMKPKRDEKQGDTKRDKKGTRQKEVTVQAR